MLLHFSKSKCIHSICCFQRLSKTLLTIALHSIQKSSFMWCLSRLVYVQRYAWRESSTNKRMYIERTRNVY